MPSKGTTNEGLEEMAYRAYDLANNVELGMYRNTSVDENTEWIELLFQQGGGSGDINLELGTWDTTDGVVTYTHNTPLVASNPELIGWEATGTWSGLTQGIYLSTTYSGGFALVHYQDLDTPFNAAPGKRLAVDLASVV